MSLLVCKVARSRGSGLCPSFKGPAGSTSAAALKLTTGGVRASLTQPCNARGPLLVRDKQLLRSVRWMPRSFQAGVANVLLSRRNWYESYQSSGRRSASPGTSLDELQDDPMLLVKIIIGLNIIVFLLWHILDERFMRRHFMVSRKNVREGDTGL
jgi:hypothetical protein